MYLKMLYYYLTFDMKLMERQSGMMIYSTRYRTWDLVFPNAEMNFRTVFLTGLKVNQKTTLIFRFLFPLVE